MSPAAAANAHHPSAANPAAGKPLQKSTAAPLSSPHRPRQHTPERNDDIAQWIATNDDEQAGNSTPPGPAAPIRTTRPEATLIDVPVNLYPCSPRYPYCRNSPRKCRCVHPGRRTTQRQRVNPACSNAPRNLQHPLLRIHRQHFTRSDAEEPGVKAGGVSSRNAPPSRVGFASVSGSGSYSPQHPSPDRSET